MTLDFLPILGKIPILVDGWLLPQAFARKLTEARKTIWVEAP